MISLKKKSLVMEKTYTQELFIFFPKDPKDYYQPNFFNTSLVLFLSRVKTITIQAKIHGGKSPVENLVALNHSGASLKNKATSSVITATPTSIFVTGFTNESFTKPTRATSFF